MLLEKDKIYIEKCMGCNGSKKAQKFDKDKNKWIKSDFPCDVCNGEGIRRYVDNTKPADFVYSILYLPNLIKE